MWRSFVLFTEPYILKDYVNNVIFLKMLLAKDNYLCDLNVLGFNPWKNIRNSFCLTKYLKRKFTIHWVISCEITHHS